MQLSTEEDDATRRYIRTCCQRQPCFI